MKRHLLLGRKAMTNLESESESPSVVSDSLQPHGLYSPWNSPGQNTGVDSLSLLHGILTNLDCILKSRDITLLTKIHIVKAMVFPVVKYGGGVVIQSLSRV